MSLRTPREKGITRNGIFRGRIHEIAGQVIKVPTRKKRSLSKGRSIQELVSGLKGWRREHSRGGVVLQGSRTLKI